MYIIYIVYMYILIHTHTYTHTHTYSQPQPLLIQSLSVSRATSPDRTRPHSQMSVPSEPNLLRHTPSDLVTSDLVSLSHTPSDRVSNGRQLYQRLWKFSSVNMSSCMCMYMYMRVHVHACIAQYYIRKVVYCIYMYMYIVQLLEFPDVCTMYIRKAVSRDIHV